jgi:sorbitol/mannitol transport system permease protein
VHILVFLAIGFQIVVTQIPFIVTIIFSFTGWNLLYPGSARSVGFSNYSLVFNGGVWGDLLRTLGMTLGIVAGATFLGVALALLLMRSFVGKGIVRTLLMTPFLIMTPIIAIMWKDMLLDPSYGFVNALLRSVGLGSVDFLGRMPMAVIIAMGIWQWAPFVMLIVDAGLSGIDLEIMDAAAVDGGTTWQKITRIYLPLVKHHVAVAVLLASILILPTFGKIFMTTSGGPGTDTTNLTWAVYHQVFQGYNVGLGSAWAVVTALFTALVVTVLLTRVKIRRGGQ